VIAHGVWADALVTVLFCGISFLLGVGYAIYRAIDWVDRMRAWAHAVEIEESTMEEVL